MMEHLSDQPPEARESNEYDHLFEPRVKPPDEPWAQEAQERQIDLGRAAAVFAPVPKPDTDEANFDPRQYDYLFDLAPAPEPRVVETGPRLPEQTSEGRVSAATVLATALENDAKLTEITDAYRTAQQLTGSDQRERLVDAIHDDPELRLAVGTHFLAKLEYMATSPDSTLAVPNRIARNTEKTPHKPQPGQTAKLTSREYVALLCLAKLDGTFNNADSQADAVQADADAAIREGRDFVGQHRYTADLVLRQYRIDEDGTYSLVGIR